MRGWQTPSLYLEFLTMQLHQRLKRVFPQYRVDGTENIWISKPSYNARGVGVHCLKSLKDVLSGGRKI